jgi:ribonuclease R
VDRLVQSCLMEVSAQGQVVRYEMHDGVIRSNARMTYTAVNAILTDRDPAVMAEHQALVPMFELMRELFEILNARRRRRGSIDFDLPESKIVLGEDGRVLAIERRPRNRAHRIVEEFMLAANEAVARWFGERDLPTIYRIHGLPDEDRLRTFLDLARAQGFEVPEVGAGPLALADLLERLAGHAQQRALNQLLLRAMMQAVYSPQNIGHYGLAAEHYLHFTSPIRRYPDLVVHRLLREALGESPGRRPRPGELERIAMVASDRERAAMKAERDVNAYYATLFMADRVGERSPGTVSAVVEFGLFVEMRRWWVEGLVKTEDLGDGFVLDKDGHALVEKRSGRAYRVGDELEVEVMAADPARRRIDLALVEGGETRALTPASESSRRGRGAKGKPERKGGGKRPGKGAGGADRAGRKKRRR